MAQDKDQLTDRSQVGSRQARANIDVTRQAMDRTIDAIGGKLTPTQLLMEGLSLLGKGGTSGANKLVDLAREHPVPAAVIGVGVGMMIRDAAGKKPNGGRTPTGGYATGYGYEGGFPGVTTRPYDEGPGVASRVHEAKDRVTEGARNARETVSHAAHDVRDTVTGAARSAKETVGEAAHAAHDRVGNVVDGARDKVGGVLDGARETAAAVAGTARETLHRVEEGSTRLRERTHVRVRDAKIGFWQTLDEQPLVVGAAAVAIGLIAGFLIPGTSREDALLGETRDEAWERAQEKGRDILQKGKYVAEAAVETLKTEAQQQGLTPSAIADKVRAVARDTVDQVKQDAQREGLVPPS